MTPLITTSGLTKRLGRTVALADIDLHVARGECVGLIGSNGGGPTTLLRILATLVRPSSGSVEIDGLDIVRHVYDVRSRLVHVGEDLPRGFGLRVRDYLDFVRAARRVSANAGAAGHVDEVLERADLSADASVDELSSGLRQRLALAAAFLVGSEVMLLDDPFRAIDLRVRSRFVDWLCEARDGGATILVALNDERDVRTICHRVVQLEAGRLVPHAHLPLSEISGVPFAALAAWDL
jgi:ABC-2 type transport system ATP-binding protein